VSKLKRLVNFCIENDAQKCFPGWGSNKIEAYLRHHLLKDSLITAKDGEGNFVGVVCYWRALWSDDYGLVNGWQSDREKADCIFLGILISINPAALKCLYDLLIEKEPERIQRKAFAYRWKAGEFVRVNYINLKKTYKLIAWAAHQIRHPILRNP
jgi:hypothetical protein